MSGKTFGRPLTSLIAALVVLLGLAVVYLHAGAVRVPYGSVWRALTDAGHPSYFIVHQLRLPRMLVAMLAGVGLAVGGVILQSVIRNPLASPDVIGITKGAGFMAALVIFVFPKVPTYVLPVAAFAGAFAAFGLLLGLSRRLTLRPSALALVGIAIGTIFQAGIQYLIVRHPSDINMALLWLSGSLWNRSWAHVWSLLPWIAVLVPVVWASFRKLNVFQLGDDMTAALGVVIARQRFWLLLLAVSLAGISVAAVGAIAFVGLIAPHIARSLVGGRHQWLVPLSALIGADLMLLGDLIGRVVILPREVPVGIMTAIIGTPYFLYLLRRSRRRG
ncbi:iron chelate uptake ABC transporter family permease subunit [Paenibacillus oryzisoli]|uniref:FecCD family ABC transporter permease n=1 Tax=Paenibacillus oryzisoli TaxID=1850517 RepID=UPI003D26C6AA